MASQNIQNLYETALRLLRRGAMGNLRNLLCKLHAADVAQVIKHFDEKGQDELLSILGDSADLPAIFSELGGGFLKQYLERHENYSAMVEVLQRLPSDDRALLIRDLPEDMSTELLSRMRMEESQEITGLLQYQEATAGGLMSTEIFKLKESSTVAEAVHTLQSAPTMATVFYIYVVDDFDNLTGVLSIKSLFQVDKSLKLKDIMLTDVMRVRVDEPQREVARVVAQYDIVAVPVVDDNNKLVGVITVDDVIDVIQEEAAHEVLKMGSAESDAIEEFSFVEGLKKRLVWFLILLVGGILTCEVITYYYRFIPPVGIFAGFIPLILRFGGIMARQTSTIVIQGLSSHKLRTRQLVFKVLLQQGQVTSVIALGAALVVGFYSSIRFSDFAVLPLAIGVALFSSMIVALFLGVFIPVGFSKLKVDPAWAIGTPINFILDILGLFIYFRILMAFLFHSA